MSEVQIEVFGKTDVGTTRDHNEDQFLVADLAKSMLVEQTSLPVEDQTRLMGGTQGKVLIVADGMGGHASGDRASSLVVHTLTSYLLNTMPWFFRLSDRREDDLVEELVSALRGCQFAIRADSQVAPDRAGMGTTLTMAYVLWPRLYVFHAGDSRAYLYRGGHLEQVTKDHTVAQRMVDQGQLEADQVEDSQFSHVLWNAIVADGSHEVISDVYKAMLEPGDTLLLCSDGLSKHVNDEHMERVLGAGHATASDMCDHFIAAANENGGTDNITVVIARFNPLADQPQPGDQAGAAQPQADPAGSLAGRAAQSVPTGPMAPVRAATPPPAATPGTNRKRQATQPIQSRPPQNRPLKPEE